MRRAIPTLAAAVALAVPATASADDFAISMPGKYFDPQRLTVVAGDQVSWRNADFVSHEVRATNGAFDSGPIGRQAVYLHRFDSPGSYALVCSIHPFMTGAVDVVGATLNGPKAAVVAGEPVRLEGRAPAGSGPVSLEEQAADGTWKPVSSTATGADGAFAFTMPAHETASYRAVSAAGASRPVAVSVSARVELDVRVHTGHVMVRTKPASRGLVATLQLYSRERFSYRRIAHSETDRKGTAEFRLRRGLRGTVRVLLSRAERGPALGVSHAVRLRDGRMVADPMPDPAPPGGHGPGHA
jgi:plastocyanin